MNSYANPIHAAIPVLGSGLATTLLLGLVSIMMPTVMAM